MTGEREMAKNMGGGDRIIRAAIGVGLMLWVMFTNSNFVTEYMIPIAVVGFILIVTAVVGWCPAYLPFGISTKKS
jgi:hypothetical protein